ncbi:hypothetical protein [Streptomyces beihaiensis]|uniref:Lipoprotein n=1 Tax=Streptomyces beihaiensis TaxID=2984495 RepID=A0ABT3TXX4_9ACTN|nr:hypothetical protein [Streptomyces beihaiensis]MCX3061898.1 hypothetical protein [Streptomyces beihaiensis]
MYVRYSGTLVAAVAVMCLLTGCSSSATSPGAEPAPADSADPQDWVLPLQSYMPTEQEQGQLAQAKKILVGDCMKGFGFTWTPAPDLPKVGPKTLTDWRYGIHDMALAKERGYKPDAKEQAAYDAAMRKGAVDGAAPNGPQARVLDGRAAHIDGKKVPEGGCVGEANRKIDATAVQARTALGLANAAFVKSKQDPAVVTAFAKWSSCMKHSGYDYKEPLDASDDPRFGGPQVSPEEIATATADIRCRRKTHVAWIWYQAESALQKKAIDDHAEELTAERHKIDAAVRNASKIVSGG